jgi:hypothetical protein
MSTSTLSAKAGLANIPIVRIEAKKRIAYLLFFLLSE